jgi:hypothetical protein
MQEAVASCFMVVRSDALVALVLTLDLQVCLAADLREFLLTTVMSNNAITLCALTEDTRQV